MQISELMNSLRPGQAGHSMTLPIALLVAILATPPGASAQEQLLEFKSFPDAPIFSNAVNPGLKVFDIFLHNMGIINRSSDPLDVQRISFRVIGGGNTLGGRTMGRSEIETLAERYYRNDQYGVFGRLPELFGHDQMFAQGERVSATPLLEPETALITIQEYFAYKGIAEELQVNVDFTRGTGTTRTETRTWSVPIKPYISPNTFQLPFAGRWYVTTGPDVSGHHRNWQNTEFAYDFSRTEAGGLQFAQEGYAPGDYHVYGEPVLAIAPGVVVRSTDRFPEAPLREQGESTGDYQQRMSDRMNENFAEDPDANYGNIVIIEHGGGEFSSYAHLRQHSVKVRVGDPVKAGDQLGEVGQSGNSLKPHLHFNVALASGRSIPARFENAYALDGEQILRLLRTGEFIASR